MTTTTLSNPAKPPPRSSPSPGSVGRTLWSNPTRDAIVCGPTSPLIGLMSQARRLARAPSVDVLIEGETGAGKELFARLIHRAGPRAKAPFVPVNCAAFSKELFESEMFGHEPGSFTGAKGRKIGWFETAQGGTLFLDEISELDLSLQAKLLRTLQERVVTRIGGRMPIPVDVRIIASTNVRLFQAVLAKTFREDLFHRLYVGHLAIPPLRDRPGDIPLLVAHFLDENAPELGQTRVEPEAMRYLEQQPWPGNARQLGNFLKRVMLLADGTISRDLAADEYGKTNSRDQTGLALHVSEVLEQARRGVIHEPWNFLRSALEQEVLRQALLLTAGNQSAAAKLLGISRNTIHERNMK